MNKVFFSLTEWFGIERTLQDHLVSIPVLWAGDTFQ